jgi:hypothetical protein
MKALFVELPAFERHRAEYLDDEGFSKLQDAMMADPAAGDVLFTLYGKDEMSDLSPTQRKALKVMVEAEVKSRRTR